MRNYWFFVRRHWALLSFGFLCVFWGNFGQSFFIGWYGDTIRESLNLSAQAYGATYSLATLLGATTIMWAGGLIDRWPLRRFVIVVSIGLVLGCVLLSLAGSIWSLCLAFFCVRLFGQALLPHTGMTTIARHFQENRGKAISLASSGVSFGEVLLPALAVLLMQMIGWQQSWLVIAVSVPLLFLPLAFLLLKQAQWRDRHIELTVTALPSPSSGRKLLLTDRRFWFAAPTTLSVPFMLTAIFIHQGFILEQKLWTPQWMASCFIVYGVVHWLSSIAFGVLVDRYSGVTLLRVYSLPLVTALFVVANFEGQWVAALMMALLGVSIGASGPVIGGLWAEVYGPKMIGGVRSAAGALMVFSTSVSPLLFGGLIDQGGTVEYLFNGAAVVFLACLALLRFSYRHSDPLLHRHA